ncbi:MAG: FAD binding domain-containing protein [Microcella sp.]|uniref:FAD binding domain-containing protein n=1 Tax=Microcella sp. TaxID=1913979 RepID=UPI0033149CB8
MLPPFRLARPSTLDEALEALGEDQVAYCGGTELLLAMRAGLTRPEALVDVKRLPELSGIAVDGGHLVIGARETHMDVAANPFVLRHLPMLVSVVRNVGNARVRAQGSVGGNLCFAEPKSDLGTALIAFQATVTLASPRGRRELTVEDFIVGPYYAEKEPDELLVDVRIPIPAKGTRATYLKYQTMERPTVGIALVDDPDSGQSRLAIGAVGETSMAWNFTSMKDIDSTAISNEIDPTPDLAGSERYKRHITKVYVDRAINNLAKVG